MSDPAPDARQATPDDADSGRALARLPWAFIAAQVALVAVLALWLLGGHDLGIQGQWAWEIRRKPLLLYSLLRAAVFGAAIIGVCWLGLRRIRARSRSDAPVVAGLIPLAFSLQLSIASLSPQAALFMVAGTGSSVATEYFTVARGIRDPWSYCRTYAVTQPRGHHVATHPPGAVLTYWLCLRVYGSPAFPREACAALTELVIGAPREAVAAAAGSYPQTVLDPQDVGAAMFCCLVFGVSAALTLVPVYWLTSRAAKRSTAMIVCCLFALAPAPILFFQGLDAPVLLLATTALALAHAAVTKQRLWAGALCGLTLGLLCTITFGAMAALATVALAAGLLARRLPVEQRRRAYICLAVGAAIWLAAMVVLHLLCDRKLPLIFTQAMAAHRHLTWAGFHRRYAVWVVLNLVEFACFLGLPTLVAVFAGVGRTARRGLSAMGRADLIGLAGLLVLLVLNLSGGVRGEVGRVWMFMMPPLVLVAGAWLSAAPHRKRELALLTAALTLGQLLLLGWALTPIVRPY